jgi:hypothetical protein
MTARRTQFRRLAAAICAMLFLAPALLASFGERYGERPMLSPQRVGMLESGQTMESLLASLDVPRERIGTLCSQLAQVGDPRRLRVGQEWNLSRDSYGDPWLCIADGPQRRYRLPLVEGAVSVDSALVQRVLRVAEGTVEGTLYESLLAAGGDPATILNYVDIFQWDVDFLTDIRNGDRFWLVWEEELFFGGWHSEGIRVSGRILAAEFQQGDQPLRAVYSELGPTPGYYDEAGQSFQKQFLRSPLNYRRISSGFGMRNHPVARKVRLHKGVDYAAPTGTPVVSAARGVVEFCGWQRGYGNVIRVKHNKRYATLYGHLHGFAKGLRRGSKVDQNELIGFVGSTGLSTGPHLHYEMIDNGRSINPYSLKNTTVDPIPETRMAEFRDFFLRGFPISRDEDWQALRRQRQAAPDQTAGL